MIIRYMVAKVENINNKNLWAVLDYNKDMLITWVNDEKTAYQIAEALEKAEEEFFLPFDD